MMSSHDDLCTETWHSEGMGLKHQGLSNALSLEVKTLEEKEGFKEWGALKRQQPELFFFFLTKAEIMDYLGNRKKIVFN